MKYIGVYGEVQVNDADARHYRDALATMCFSKSHYFSRAGHYHGTLRIIDQGEHWQVSYQLHIAPHLQAMTWAWHTVVWKKLFNSFVMKNYGFKDLEPKNDECCAGMQRKLYDTTMSVDEPKVLFQVVYTTR